MGDILSFANFFLFFFSSFVGVHGLFMQGGLALILYCPFDWYLILRNRRVSRLKKV